jgi:hypothetical protein
MEEIQKKKKKLASGVRTAGHGDGGGTQRVRGAKKRGMRRQRLRAGGR